MNSTPNQISYHIARRVGHQGARPSMRNQVEVEKYASGTKLLTNRKPLKIASFNVRTLSNDKNLYELTGLAELHNISVICIQEHRIYHPNLDINHQIVGKGWILITCSADKNSQNASIGGVGLLINPQIYKSLMKTEKISSRIIQATFDGNPKTTITSCYSPTNISDEHMRTSFYTLLSESIRAIPKHNVQIVGGDMNAKINPEDCTGNSFNKKTNFNGQALLTLLEECNLILLNTKFKKRKGKLWTFLYPNGEKAQLDYILINKKWQNSATDCEAYSSFSSVGSDHRIITSTIKLKLRANKTKNQQQQKI